jgi:chromosome segregation ATPase
MTSDLPDPAELTRLLRQQLILAQVRIMELEDVRDDLAPRLARVESLLAAAQELADLKTGEAAHLDGVREDLEGQVRHLRHVQHVTHEALEAARAETAAAAQALAAERQTASELRARSEALAAAVASLEARVQAAEQRLAGSEEESARRLARIGQLDTELRAMKASRSWRWTAWLRSVERALRRKP